MILNRMIDPEIPDTVSGVIYEPGAFLAADEESIDEKASPDELEEYIILAKLIYAYGIDPTCGAVFCFFENDPEASDLNITISVEGLVFAKPQDVT